MMNETVTRAEWLKARKQLLRDEKAFTRLKDALALQRRALPRVRLDKSYQFLTNDGPRSLAALFDGRSQLVVYHFMYGPDWDEGCMGCSEVADNFNGTIWHMNQRDASMIAVSRAPLKTLNAYKQRMDWTFEWVSSLESDFNFDFDVSFEEAGLSKKRVNFETVETEMDETHGVSVFVKEGDDIFHTYSCHMRGVEMLCGNMQILDLLPKGRQDDLFWAAPTRRA